jgi:hypothetical protein
MFKVHVQFPDAFFILPFKDKYSLKVAKFLLPLLWEEEEEGNWLH